MKYLLNTILLLCGALAACAAQPHPWTMFVHPSDHVERAAAASYAVQAQPLEDANDASMVARQAALGGLEVLLWLGQNSDPNKWERAPRLMQLARQYANIHYVYLYDEMFWDKDLGVVVGQHEDEILTAAAQARAVGLHTVVTILPDVILSPQFKLKDITAFDGISIDVYPSIRPTHPDLQGCSANLNSYTADLFYCSVQKLRGMGFRGHVLLLYQAFAVRTLPLATTLAHLQDQRIMVNNAGMLGASGISPWGLYLGAVEHQLEPSLQPLGRTDLEYLVTPY